MDENLKKEQEQFMTALEKKMNEVIDARLSGQMTTEQATDMISKSVSDALAKADEQHKQDISELEKSMSALNDKLAKLEQKGVGMTPANRFDERLKEMFESEKYKDYMNGLTRKSGKFDNFSLKDIVSLTDNYTGEILISEQQKRVVSQFGPKKLHMRDILPVLQGDPEFPNLTYAEITDLDRNARYVTENGRLPASSFDVKEVTVPTKRLGTYIRLSKRMLKSRVYVRSYVLAMLPEAVLMAEDAGILFGDGNGEQLEGIANKSGVLPVEDIITETIVSGKLASIKAYNGGKDALLEFDGPYAAILDGMRITITGDYAGTYDVIKKNDRQVIIKVSDTEGKVSDVEDASAVTFTVNHGAFKSIEAPNSLDVVKTAFAVMNYAQYNPTAIVMNPITVNAIESEKDTTGRNLGLVMLQNGAKTIAGRPIIEYTGIPAGKYLIGDFSINGCSLVDYTKLSLEWADDVEDKLTNTIHLIAQEEIIFPVYNPWAFAYGDIAALKEAITAE